MFIYDETTIAFIQRCQDTLRSIIEEIGFTVYRTRFEYKRYFYPINVVVFEGSELGHFNAPYLQIGLNKKLIYLAKDSVLRDILKHELAHYLTYLRHGEVKPHGKEFHDLCREFNFPDDVAGAKMDLEESNLAKEGDLKSERILEKIKKLLQLAQSSNAHEAELATVKANELLLRHNLEGLGQTQKESIYLDRILARPKKDAKMVAIYEILRHFIVRPVMSYGKGTCCLEISGTMTNVKLARYVGEFLDRELDHLWKNAQKEEGLSGLRAKNSFFIGVARGFDEKMKRAKEAFSESDQKALILVEKQLDVDTKHIYRRLSSTTSAQRLDGAAQEAGRKRGHDLTIRQGVESKSGKSLYLPHHKS